MGAPSISSMIRQLGFSSAPSTDFIWVAASMRVLKTSGLRSSLQEKTVAGGSVRHHRQQLSGPSRAGQRRASPGVHLHHVVPRVLRDDVGQRGLPQAGRATEQGHLRHRGDSQPLQAPALAGAPGGAPGAGKVAGGRGM